MNHESSDSNAPKPVKPGYNQMVPAVEQASRILFCLAKSAHPQLSLTDICKQVGIHKSKGYSILNTLMEFSLVVRHQGARTYSLGPALLFLSRSVLDHMDLRDLVSPYLEELAEATQSTALLGLIRSEHVFIVTKSEARADIGVTIRMGQRYPLTWGAHGKAIAACLPEEQNKQLIQQQDLRFYGKTGVNEVNVDLLERELGECRQLGYAKDLGQVHPGINAVSAALLGSGSNPVGCLIVVGTFPTAMADSFGEKTAAMSRKISSLLGPTIESVYGLKDFGESPLRTVDRNRSRI